MSDPPPILEYSQPRPHPARDKLWGVVFALCSISSGVIGAVSLVALAIWYVAPEALSEKRRPNLWSVFGALIVYFGVLWLSLVAARLAKHRFREAGKDRAREAGRL
jgi:hypothetical protein